MNQYDVSGVLTTYALKCSKVKDKEHLKDLVRELKRELNTEAIRKLEKV